MGADRPAEAAQPGVACRTKQVFGRSSGLPPARTSDRIGERTVLNA
jgi:hypothetical protein